ncbi:MAG: hypothetical protein ABJA57_06080 [Ginsengibacter sp.]
MKLKIPGIIVVFLPLLAVSQRITYSEAEREDTRALDFEVIGKVSGNILVYKNIRNKNAVSVYDNDMKLKERVDLSYVPDKTINVDFVPYQDFAYLIYQYQKRNTLHCMAVKLDGEAKSMGAPVELDTTYISVFADNKIYSTIFSEDKRQIMIYKIQKKNEKFYFTTHLYDASLNLMHTSRISIPYDEHKDALSDFMLDNDGNFIFTKGLKSSARDLIGKLTLMIKPPAEDNFVGHEINLNTHYLDEVKIKVDNFNKHYIINSFYYRQRHGNIDGLFSLVWNSETKTQGLESVVPFSDTLKMEAKAEGSAKFAFNDYFIRHVVAKKDGGFIVVSEDYYTQSRGNPWNRMDYLYGYPYLSAYDYYLYSPSGYWYSYRPRSFYSSAAQTRYYYDNIVVMNLDKNGKLIWSNVVHKSQFDDETDNYLSYQIMNEGGELHFLFNEVERRNQLLSDQSIVPDGQLKRNPTLKSLDKGYAFMPRFAKQVSAKQIIVPCTFRNYICFAKLDY